MSSTLLCWSQWESADLCFTCALNSHQMQENNACLWNPYVYHKVTPVEKYRQKHVVFPLVYLCHLSIYGGSFCLLSTYSASWTMWSFLDYVQPTAQRVSPTSLLSGGSAMCTCSQTDISGAEDAKLLIIHLISYITKVPTDSKDFFPCFWRR